MNFDSGDLQGIGNLILTQRKKKKLSQAFIATKLETKASAISNIENGKRSVPREKVEVLAKLLDLQPKDLIPTRRILNEMKDLSVAFRGVEALPKEALEELQSHYLRLKQQYASKKSEEKKTPVQVALELLLECGISKPPVDLDAICKQLKADVVYNDKIDFDGYIFQDSKKGFSGIGVKLNTSQGRKRFTVAHELGHLRLGHLSGSKKIECNDTGVAKSENERDANSFASNLLMPEKWVKEAIDEGIHGMETIVGISDTFQVSRTTAAIRLAEVSNTRCAVIMSEGGVMKWGVASKNLGGWITRGSKLARGSQAHKLTVNPLKAKKTPTPTKSEYWFESSLRGKFREHSSRLYQDSVLTLIWES